MTEQFMPVDKPFAFARKSQAEMDRQLRLARAGRVGRAFNPRWAGDGRSPDIRTDKPGAFRTRPD